jgi:DNA-binding NarL/FixJ family response regulator
MPTKTDALGRLEDVLARAPRLPAETALLDLDGGSDPGSIPPAAVYIAPCDLSRPQSIEAIGALAERLPGPLVLLVEAAAQTREMRAAMRAGAAGLVREQDVAASLAGTVAAVKGGQLAVPLELARRIEKPVLSRRQKQVLGLVVLGLNNGEIATKMHLSEHTVKCHLYASFRKLGVSSRDEAVSLILDPDEGLGTGILTISA